MKKFQAVSDESMVNIEFASKEICGCGGVLDVTTETTQVQSQPRDCGQAVTMVYAVCYCQKCNSKELLLQSVEIIDYNELV